MCTWPNLARAAAYLLAIAALLYIVGATSPVGCLPMIHVVGCQ